MTIEHSTHCYVCTGCAYTTHDAIEATKHERELGVLKHPTFVAKIQVDTQKNDDGTNQIIVQKSVFNANQRY